MFDNDPHSRWNVDQIEGCAWLNDYDKPNYKKIDIAIEEYIKRKYDQSKGLIYRNLALKAYQG